MKSKKKNEKALLKLLLQQFGEITYINIGIIVSDCGAIADFYNDRGHHTHPDVESASAAAVVSGTDLECGSSYKALVEVMFCMVLKTKKNCPI